MEYQEVLAMGLRLSPSSDLTQKRKLSPRFHKVSIQVTAIVLFASECTPRVTLFLLGQAVRDKTESMHPPP